MTRLVAAEFAAREIAWVLIDAAGLRRPETGLAAVQIVYQSLLSTLRARPLQIPKSERDVFELVDLEFIRACAESMRGILEGVVFFQSRADSTSLLPRLEDELRSFLTLLVEECQARVMIKLAIRADKCRSSGKT